MGRVHWVKPTWSRSRKWPARRRVTLVAAEPRLRPSHSLAETVTADALSTVLFLLPRSEAAWVLRAGGGTDAWLFDGHGPGEHLEV